MTSFPVPDGPHNDDWKRLVDLARVVVEEACPDADVTSLVQAGGGSMLLRRYRHRRSRDLDLFVPDVRIVRACSPRFNEAAGDLFPDYAEDAASVKLVIGLQEIDIIAAAPLFDPAAGLDPEPLPGWPIRVERPREILAKKLAYRGRRLQPRDIFDLAAVAAAEPEEVAAAIAVLQRGQVEAIRSRLTEFSQDFAKEIGLRVDAYPEFAGIRDESLTIVRDVFAGLPDPH